MRRTIPAIAFSALLASGAASFTLLPGSEAGTDSPAQETFLVSADDGYGLGDCLTSGAECGQVVADSWCQTQGFARATAYGPTRPEDLTGTIRKVSLTQARPVSISCTK